MTERDGELPLAGVAPAAPRGPGRPKGARNKRGRDWQAYAASLKVHPLELMLADVQKTDRELATELELFERDEDGNVRRDEMGQIVLQANALRQARALRYDAARDALPYIEQKLPALDEDDARGDKRILMIVGNLTAEQTAQATRSGLPFALKQNQQVSEAEIVQSDDAQSDGEPNMLTIHEDRENDH